jgi:hypothetical protein
LQQGDQHRRRQVKEAEMALESGGHFHTEGESRFGGKFPNYSEKSPS